MPPTLTGLRAVPQCCGVRSNEVVQRQGTPARQASWKIIIPDPPTVWPAGCCAMLWSKEDEDRPRIYKIVEIYEEL